MFRKIKNNLKDILKINNSIILDNPIVVTQDKSIILKFDNTSKDVTFEQPIGIYNLSRFLNVLDVFGDDFESKVENGVIYIKKGKLKQKYETTAPELLEDTRIDPNLFEKVKAVEPFTSFNLSVELLKYIKKIAGILGHQNIVIENGKIIVTTLDANDNYIDENIIENEKITIDEKIVLDVDAINKLPEMNYNVTFHKNPKNGNVVAYFTANDEPYEILVAVSKII